MIWPITTTDRSRNSVSSSFYFKLIFVFFHPTATYHRPLIPQCHVRHGREHFRCDEWNTPAQFIETFLFQIVDTTFVTKAVSVAATSASSTAGWTANYIVHAKDECDMDNIMQSNTNRKLKGTF